MPTMKMAKSHTREVKQTPQRNSVWGTAAKRHDGLENGNTGQGLLTLRTLKVEQMIVVQHKPKSAANFLKVSNHKTWKRTSDLSRFACTCPFSSSSRLPQPTPWVLQFPAFVTKENQPMVQKWAYKMAGKSSVCVCVCVCYLVGIIDWVVRIAHLDTRLPFLPLLPKK